MLARAPVSLLPRALAARLPTLLAALAIAPAAQARLYDRDPPRTEVGLEPAVPLYDADAALAGPAPDLRALRRFSISIPDSRAPDAWALAMGRAVTSGGRADRKSVV